MKCAGAGGACIHEASTVVVSPKGPRAVCVCHVSDFYLYEEQDLDPAVLPVKLLREWIKAEKKEQQRQREVLKRTQVRFMASLSRAEAVEKALSRQEELALEGVRDSNVGPLQEAL